MPASNSTTSPEWGILHNREALDVLVDALRGSSLVPQMHSFSWLGTLVTFLWGILFCLGCLAAGWLTLQRSERFRRRVESATRAAREGIPLDSLRALFGTDLPTWLANPDISRMDWANTVLEGMWSQVGAAAVKWAVLDGNLEQLLNTTTFWRPAWLASSGIQVKGLALGQVPPVITGVTAYKAEEGTIADRMMLDFNFSWSSKLHARMDVQVLPTNMKFPILGSVASFLTRRSIVKVFVRDLVASGTIRAQLRPLMNKIPVVGAVKISFLGSPAFTYKVSSYGVNPMFIPGLETFINSFVSGQVLQPFTYPDGFVIKLDPTAGDVVSELPEGLLTVTLKEATGVPRMDWYGGADPYVKLWVNEGLKMHSVVRSRTRHPVWDESFRLTVHDHQHQALRFVVYDADAFRRDDEIGRAELLLKDLDLSEPRDVVVVIPRTGKKEARTQTDSMGFQRTRARAANAQGQLAVNSTDAGQSPTQTGPLQQQHVSLEKGISRRKPVPERDSDGPGWWIQESDETVAEREGSELANSTRQLKKPSSGLGRQLRTLRENTSDLGLQARGAFEKFADESRELLRRNKRCELHIRLAYTPFDRAAVLKAMEESKFGPHPSSPGSPSRPESAMSRDGSEARTLRRVFSGGVLYVYLDHGTDLYSKSLEGYTKNMRCRLTVGRHSRETECSRSKLLDRKNPVFDQKLELILDGDEVDASKDEVIRVDLYTHHILLKPLHKGSVAVPLHEVIGRGQVQGSWPMQGVPRGQLTMSLTWVPALQSE